MSRSCVVRGSCCAFALVKQGRAADAIPFCEAALRLVPDFPVFLDTQALLLHQLGLSREALATIDRAIAIQPDYQTARATKEWIKANMNELHGKGIS